MSFGELILVLAIALLAIGPDRLPATGRLVGKGLRGFQRGLREARDAAGAAPAVSPERPRRAAHPPRLID